MSRRRISQRSQKQDAVAPDCHSGLFPNQRGAERKEARSRSATWRPGHFEHDNTVVRLTLQTPQPQREHALWSRDHAMKSRGERGRRDLEAEDELSVIAVPDVDGVLALLGRRAQHLPSPAAPRAITFSARSRARDFT